MTAQRRKQNLQKVPIAVTSLSARDLEQKQVNATTDIGRLVPNTIEFNNVGFGSGNVYYIRGLGQPESFPTFDPQVGTYVDDIYIGRESASNFGLFNVSQLQVLRGPQGTLFGRNSTGGAIVITLARPAPDYGGYVEGGYGSYNQVFGRGAVDIPIRDDLLTNFAFYGVKDDGYVDDKVTQDRLNGHGDWGVRESALILPHALENMSWYIAGDYGETRYDAVQDSIGNGERISYSGFGNASAPVVALNSGPIVADYERIIKEPLSTLANDEDSLTGGFVSNIQLSYDPGKFNFISGMRYLHQLSAADFPFPSASGAIIPYDDNVLGQFGIGLATIDRQYSQEAKWTGHVGSRFNYTVGGFFLYEEATQDYVETLTAPAGPMTVNAFELPAVEHFHTTTESQAVYAQGDYDLTRALQLTVGGRLTHEEKNFGIGSDSAAGFDTADIIAAGNRSSLTTDQLTPRFALQYQINPRVMAFASATRGFQGGGWNSLASNAAAVSAFGPETIWTYEGGIRTETPDKKLRFNADIFYNIINNYQLVALGPGTGNFVTENAAGLNDYGIEADFAYQPIKPLTISGNLGLETGHYVRIGAQTLSQQAACRAGERGDCSQGIVNYDGNIAPPQNFPPFTLSLNAVYDTAWRRLNIEPLAGVQVAAPSHTDTQGSPEGDSFWHYALDLGVKFQFQKSPWSLTAECMNCTLRNWVTADIFVRYYNTPGIWDLKLHRTF